MRSLGRGVVPQSVRHLAEHVSAGNDTLSQAGSLSDFFDFAYQELRANYRTEYVYKNELVSRIVFGRHSPRTTSFQTEFRTGACIADAVVFNGTSTVYEIKTELDSLQRLPDQLTAYRSVFDKIYVVTHEAGIEAVLRTAPDTVGVLHLTKRGSLTEVRASGSNANHVSPDAIFNTLRRSEYLAILERTFGWTPDVPSGRIVMEAKARFSKLSPKVAHEQALSMWRQRTTHGSLPAFVDALPASLRTLGLSEPLSEIGRLRALDCLHAPLLSV